MLGIPHPYLTSSLPGIGGRIKEQPEDFRVGEVPLYPPCGRGEHVYFQLEKIDLSTLEAVERLSRALGVTPREIGYAGLKDRKGVTQQTFSVAGVDPELVASLDVPQMRVLQVDRHSNKLRVGHLKGNRFQICVRRVGPNAEARAADILRVLEDRGVPNYFGQQRFGNRGDAHLVGRALLRRDAEGAVRRILGCPASTENNPSVVEARHAYLRGDLEGALLAFPPTYREERRLLGYLLKAPGHYGGAVKRLRDVAKRLYFTAYQSYLFNITLMQRMELVRGDLGRCFRGDAAFIHRNGALFTVENLAQAEARSQAFEISPAGPIFGLKTLPTDGPEAEIERTILEREGLRVADFHRLVPKLHLEGGRRPFRVRLQDLRWRVEGSDLWLEFFLPKGSYATTLLRELMKCEEVPEAFYENGEDEIHGLWRVPPARGEGAGETV